MNQPSPVSKVGLLYEHPTWSTELLSRLRRRDVAVTPIDIGDLTLALPDLGRPQDLWINRINAMPSAGRPATVVAAANHLLLSLELGGKRLVNGSRTHLIGGSKAAQTALFGALGLHTPPSIAVSGPADAVPAARKLGFPVLIKPNIGGSGRGIVRFDTTDELDAAVSAGTIDLGIDGTGLVQRLIDSADGIVYRVEMLGSDLFYATRQPVQDDGFNYCAVDGGSATDPGAGDLPVGRSAAIALYRPEPEILTAARRVMTAAACDVGGVEYLIDRVDGRPCFYDFNPYSNFVSGMDDLLGFNLVDRYLDAVLGTRSRLS
ncbi:MAG: ATP-grasp domain-containing protein [Acidimicrobiales bacterium]